MSAIFSACGNYRYQLHRSWRVPGTPVATILWVMLNPSTANATNDDPTIRRCIQFSKDWGYDSLMIGNAYALRSTDPKGLWAVADPVGEDNNGHLHGMAVNADRIMVAWGTNIKDARAAEVLKILQSHDHVYCLGETKDGMPKHPLYIKGDTQPVVHRLSAAA